MCQCAHSRRLHQPEESMTGSSMAELSAKQDTPREEERDASHNHLSVALWSRMWRASITAGAFLLLYSLSQVTGLWVLYMLNGYRAFPAAHKVLDLLQYLLSTTDSSDQQTGVQCPAW